MIRSHLESMGNFRDIGCHNDSLRHVVIVRGVAGISHPVNQARAHIRLRDDSTQTFHNLGFQGAVHPSALGVLVMVVMVRLRM